MQQHKEKRNVDKCPRASAFYDTNLSQIKFSFHKIQSLLNFSLYHRIYSFS